MTIEEVLMRMTRFRSRERRGVVSGTTFVLGVLLAVWSPSPVGSQQLQRRLTSHAADDRCPRWAPDESVIVFESNRSGSWDLWSVRPDGSQLRRLTDSDANDRHATWSPAGGRLAFVSDRDGSPNLYLLDVVSRRVGRIVDWPGRESFPDWSPDGRRLAFTSERDGEVQLWVVAVDGGTPRPLTPQPFRALWPRWSPDGSVVACFTRSFTDGAEDDVALLDPDGSIAPVLVTRAPGHASCPSWSPRGDELVWAAIPPAGEPHLVIGDLQGRARAPLARGIARVTEPDRAPRSGLVAYAAASGDGRHDIWLENLPRR
jgi:TolB protein